MNEQYKKDTQITALAFYIHERFSWTYSEINDLIDGSNNEIDLLIEVVRICEIEES